MWEPHGIYHVFSRGSDRRRIVTDDRDLADLEYLLLDALVATGAEALAWAFMPNHWHGLFRCPDDERGLSPLMQRVNQRHSFRSNRRRNRSAHLIQNRFGCVAQQREEQLLWTIRYVVRNPFEAGLVESLEESRWTTYRETVGLVGAPPVLRVDDVLRLFDDDEDVARLRYADFVAGPRRGIVPMSPPDEAPAAQQARENRCQTPLAVQASWAARSPAIQPNVIAGPRVPPAPP